MGENIDNQLITYFETKLLLEKLKKEKSILIKSSNFKQAALLRSQEKKLIEILEIFKIQCNIFIENFEKNIEDLNFDLIELKEIFYISDFKENETFKDWFSTIIINFKNQLEICKKKYITANDFKNAEVIRRKLKDLSNYYS